MTPKAGPMFGRALVAMAAIIVALLCGGRAQAGPPLLLRDPSLSMTQLAFAYGGDIWIAPRAGGDAHRLVTGYDLGGGPLFSPDGSLVAFTGTYDGHPDIFVVPAAGGEPRRLTAHPKGSVAVGWTPDGKNVLFHSARASATDPDLLYTVPVAGGYPTQLPLMMGETGSYSADGTHLAYVPNFRWEPFWKGYRGGQTTPIAIADLSNSRTTLIPRNNSNDDHPMWIGQSIYFLSDRSGPVTLFTYDLRSGTVTRVLPSEGFDITSASAGPGAIVYEKFGKLEIYDLATRTSRPLEVRVAGDMPQVRPHWEKVGARILNADISPTGVRAVFEAHGAILTVPAEHGDIRNVGEGPAIENRDPAWSPDGRSIAYFSDRSGEYALHVRDQRGLLPPRTIGLGAPTFYYQPVWSPDSRKILYSDKRLNLWYVDLAHPVPVKVATGRYERFGTDSFDAAWSPDSRWIAYAAQLPNFLHAIDVYDVGSAHTYRITDGMSDARTPRFDAGGMYLYFTASTNTALSSNGLDMTSDEHPVSASVYAAVLRRDTLSPVKPRSDDEPVKAQDEPEASAPATKTVTAPNSAPAKSVPAVRIDFGALDQRIVALPIPAANYVGLAAGKPGELYLTAAPLAWNEAEPPPLQVTRFDTAARKETPFLSGVSAFALAANGSKALYAQHAKWYIAATDKPPVAGTPLATDELELFVDPRAQWKQMYREVWRIERDFFYDPHAHGLDLAAAQRRFEPYLDGIAARDDLTYLFREMLGYLSVGHMFVRGGTQPATPNVTTGLLGADYRIENGRYRFSKIYTGQNWNPDLTAPLTQPGAAVAAGEYLLAVNGRTLSAADDIDMALQETAGKQIAISVGPNPTAAGSREVTVVPVADEFALRNLDWIESNRRRVGALSGGKLAYVYVPDTAYGGFTSFNRYFFSQIGKQGVIIDERFNHGGQIADYIIEYLSRKPQSILVPREGLSTLDPPLAIYGPKVMLVNQFAGSGGDALPWYFRKAGLGPIVGVRTWGGLVGIGGYPVLMDGGSVTAPRIAIGGLGGAWEVENHGVAPDIEVPLDPQRVRAGHDPQLETAVKTALELLHAHPLPAYHPPAYPNHQPVLPPR